MPLRRFSDLFFPIISLSCLLGVETFAVYVTPRMTAESRASSTAYEAERLASSRGQAHRVIMREVSDVEKRFREPIFARSMLRDHIPTNCEYEEFCKRPIDVDY